MFLVLLKPAAHVYLVAFELKKKREKRTIRDEVVQTIIIERESRTESFGTKETRG